jgi:hypothetical protein
LSDDRVVQDDKNELALERDVWQALKKELPGRPGATATRFALHYLGVPIADSTVCVAPTSTTKGDLSVANNTLLDARGNMVVIQLNGPNGARVPPLPSEKLSGEGPCKIVVVEDSLTPAEGKGAVRTFRDILKEKLSARFPKRAFDLVRVGDLDLSAVYPPLERLARVDSDIVSAKPDIVIWACSTSDILNYVPIQTFDRYLKASVEQILAQTPAAILLVSSPPIVVNPEMGHDYAATIKKGGLLYHVPTVDLFSIFCRLEDGWKSFFQDDLNRGDPVFYLYPNTAGQELLAREIYEKMLE